LDDALGTKLENSIEMDMQSLNELLSR
jgi:hypothetical protein